MTRYVVRCFGSSVFLSRFCFLVFGFICLCFFKVLSFVVLFSDVRAAIILAGAHAIVFYYRMFMYFLHYHYFIVWVIPFIKFFGIITCYLGLLVCGELSRYLTTILEVCLTFDVANIFWTSLSRELFVELLVKDHIYVFCKGFIRFTPDIDPNNFVFGWRQHWVISPPLYRLGVIARLDDLEF